MGIQTFHLSFTRSMVIFSFIITYLYLYILSLSAKLARLKQAKEEAEKEIAEFRAQMEAEFQRKLAEVRLRLENVGTGTQS